jgi:hypothetical protein
MEAKWAFLLSSGQSMLEEIALFEERNGHRQCDQFGGTLYSLGCSSPV